MTERKEILALNRFRYDELVQMTQRALIVRRKSRRFSFVFNVSNVFSHVNKRRTQCNNFDRFVRPARR